MGAFINKLSTSVRKRLGIGHSLSELDPDLVARQLYFEAPTLTPELIAAVKLISPQFRLRQDETSRRFWELNQNGVCWGEYLALEPFLKALPEPSKVADLGPGLGRSVIFFKKIMGWQSVPFHLYEGAGESTKYTKAGPKFDDSFCGTPEALETLLRHNGIESYQIFDAMEMGGEISGLPGPYDFIYSFFAIGFHWSIVHFLDDLLDLMHDRSIGAFTLHDRFTDLDALSHVPHRVVEMRRSWPRGKTSRLLVLGKTEEALQT